MTYDCHLRIMKVIIQNVTKGAESPSMVGATGHEVLASEGTLQRTPVRSSDDGRFLELEWGRAQPGKARGWEQGVGRSRHVWKGVRLIQHLSWELLPSSQAWPLGVEREASSSWRSNHSRMSHLPRPSPGSISRPCGTCEPRKRLIGRLSRESGYR